VTGVAFSASGFAALESALRDLVRSEEAAHSARAPSSDSLWDHLLRTARITENLGREEGLDPIVCRLAGLFHDAGKFHNGELHGDDLPEEHWSADVLRRLASDHGIDGTHVELIADAILQLYRDDPDPTPLARVLDGDSICVKRGLKGKAVSTALLYRFTVELTYARHAPDCMLTSAGRELARRRGPETESFIVSFLEQLREDGLADFTIDEVEFDGLLLCLVAPRSCRCGSVPGRKLWQVPGIKCHEIHVSHTCPDCGTDHEIRFCRPRLARGDSDREPSPRD